MAPLRIVCEKLLCRLLVAAPLAMASLAWAADPERGRLLYLTPPQPGLLACVDCHGEKPQSDNFGNIWAGRHASFLIDRAIAINTGGMGYFRNFMDRAATADIAAWLGTTPASVAFTDTTVGASSTVRGLTLSSSTKAPITGLSWRAEGDFRVSPGSCTASVDRFASCTLEVAFAPSEPGPRAGALLVSHDASPTPIRIPLGGTGQSPPATVVAFGPALPSFAAGSPPRAAVLRNEGGATLRVREVRVSGPGFRWEGGSCSPGLAVLPGASCTVLLAFAPAQSGAEAGLASVAHDGRGGLSTLELRGEAEAALPRLFVSPSSIDLGTLAVGEAATSGWVTVSNPGPGEARWASPRSGDTSFIVSASDCAEGALLGAGAACRMKITFRPLRAGRFTATLRWAPSSSARLPDLPVSGVATVEASPASTAAGPVGVQAPSPSTWAVDQIFLPMGAGPGAARLTRRLTVHNLGEAALDPRQLAITGDAAREFSLGGDCRPGLPVPRGQACRIDVTRTPLPGATAVMASLLVQAGPAGERATILLDGSRREETPTVPGWVPAGPVAPDTAWEVRVAGIVPTTSVDAGALAVGAAEAARVVTVINRGASPSPPLRWRVDGQAAADWSIGVPAGADACRAGQALVPGGSCTLLLQFHPAGPGARSGWLFLPTTDGRPVLALTGTGLVPASGRVTASPAGLVFQAQPGATPPEQVLVLGNEGAAEARVTGVTLAGPGYVLSPGTSGSCPAPPFDLLPGLSCTVGVAWAGTPSGASGSALVVSVEGAADLRVALEVAEDPALRRNEGGGGGAAFGLWWLALAGAAGLLHRRAARRPSPP
jgi:hypothetical protein